MNTLEGPLAGPPPVEVPLASPPLVRVIAQVRFPLIASVEKQDFIGPFQEAIRSDYPVLRPEESRSVTLGSEGVIDARKVMSWRFHSPRSGWQVTLAPEFLALETRHYTSRDDFMARLQAALQALEAHVGPSLVDRLGVRYIDRVLEPHLSDLPALVRPEVIGVLGTRLAEYTLQSVCQHVFDIPDGTGQLMARWGRIPGRSTVDPAAIEPIDGPSWILDLDAFQAFDGNAPSFSVERLIEQARAFTERIYSVFRWVVEDEFLRRYGGEP